MKSFLVYVLATPVLCGIAYAQDLGVPVLRNGKRLSVELSAPPGGQKGTKVLDFGPTDPISADFNVILFRGQSLDPKAIFEASLQADQPRWVRAQIWRFKKGHFWGRFLISGQSGSTLVFRIRHVKFNKEERFKIHSFEAATVQEGGSCVVGNAAVPGNPIILDGGIAILPRDAWGAACWTGPYEAMKPVRITIHHTAGDQAMTKEDGIEEMRLIQHYHQVGRGWIDIGYHFVIDGAGDIFQGRPENAVGAHTLKENEGNIGISLMGNFQPDPASGNDGHPTGQQIQALKTLVRWLVREYHINPETIRGHRDFRLREVTACPGDNLHSKLPEVKVAAKEAFAAISEGLPKRQIQISSVSSVLNLRFGQEFTSEESKEMSVLFDAGETR